MHDRKHYTQERASQLEPWKMLSKQADNGSNAPSFTLTLQCSALMHLSYLPHPCRARDQHQRYQSHADLQHCCHTQWPGPDSGRGGGWARLHSGLPSSNHGTVRGQVDWHLQEQSPRKSVNQLNKLQLATGVVIVTHHNHYNRDKAKLWLLISLQLR